MKTQQVVLTTSVEATADLPARRFAGFYGGVCAAGAKALGVVEAATDNTNVAPINVLGSILIETGAAISAGQEVESDASGRAIPKAAGAGNGFARDAATGAGEPIRILRGI